MFEINAVYSLKMFICLYKKHDLSDSDTIFAEAYCITIHTNNNIY